MGIERFGDLLIDLADVRAVSIAPCFGDDGDELIGKESDNRIGIILLRDGLRLECQAESARKMMDKIKGEY